MNNTELNNRRDDCKAADEPLTKEKLIALIARFVEESPQNRIRSEDAICPELAGLRLFDAPLVGVSSAQDSLYTEEFKREGVISPDYRAPGEWLPGAKSVISVFLPFTEEVRRSNRTKEDVPYEDGLPQRSSAAWLHGRIEGQSMVNALTDYIQQLLTEAGMENICPTTSGQLRMIAPYISTWSERHAAYAAGLGTFGLSRGLITEKGMAGRIGSVITSGDFAADKRPYTDPFEYCLMCGACERRCPAGAIRAERGCARGKDQTICGPYVNGGWLPPHGPRGIARYGCGKCQAAVPCEDRIPRKNAAR